MPRESKGAAGSFYSVHPSVAYARSIVANLPKKTGRSFDEWARLVRKAGPKVDGDRRRWLKEKHGLGGTQAWMVVDHAAGRANVDTDPAAYLAAAPEMVEAMYRGGKSGLRPLHDALVDVGRSLGRDVKVCPCKTIVPLYREHVFAEIKPATKSRIDLGLALRHAKRKVPERILESAGLKKGDRITHRIPITSLDEIDAEVEGWLQIAYDLDQKDQ